MYKNKTNYRDKKCRNDVSYIYPCLELHKLVIITYRHYAFTTGQVETGVRTYNDWNEHVEVALQTHLKQNRNVMRETYQIKYDYCHK